MIKFRPLKDAYTTGLYNFLTTGNIADDSGNLRTITTNGTTTVVTDSPFGTGVRVTGSQYFMAPQNTLSPNEGTLELVVKLDTWGGSQTIYQWDNNYMYIEVYNGNITFARPNISSVISIPVSSLSAGHHYIVVTWSVSGNFFRVYIDGVKIGERDNVTSWTPASSSGQKLGRWGLGAEPVTGVYSYFRTSSVARTDKEIWDNYIAGSGMISTRLDRDKYTVGLWHLNDPTKTTGTLNGTLTGVPTWSNGELVFPGTAGSGILVPDNNIFSFTTAFTMEIWFKASEPNGSTEMLIAKEAAGSIWPEYYVLMGSTGRLTACINFAANGTNAIYVNSLAGVNYIDGNWHHVAVTYNQVSAIMYVDGEVTESTPKTLAMWNSAAQLGIGRDPGNPQYNFKGSLKECRLWNICRTQSQIQATINSSLLGNETGLVGYWPMNEGSGAEAKDRTVNKKAGSISVATWSVNSGEIPALYFDGYNDYISVTRNTLLEPANYITLEAKVILSDIVGAKRVISKGIVSTDNYTTGYSFSVYNGSLFIQVRIGASLREVTFANPGGFVVGIEYHIAVVYDGVYLRGYVNGVEVGTPYAITGVITHRTTADGYGVLYIGSHAEISTQNFQGVIKDVRVWNVARTQPQIQEKMNDTLTGEEPGLVLWYPLNEGSGTVATDKRIAYSGTTTKDYSGRGSGLHGTITGATWSNDYLNFNGTSSKITTATNTALQPTQYTVEAWVNSTNPLLVAGQFILTYDSSDSNSLGRGYALSINTSGKIQINKGSGDGGWEYAIGTTVLSANTWYHVAATYNGSTFAIYLNGIAETISATNNNTTTISYTNATGLRIGFTTNGSNPDGAFFSGTIRDVRIWNTARSQVQIQSTMNTGLFGDESGLVGYWPMNEGQGTKVLDNSDHGAVMSLNSTGGWEDTPIGKGLILNGTSSYGTAVLSTIGTTFTIEVVAKLTNLAINDYKDFVVQAGSPSVYLYLVSGFAGTNTFGCFDNALRYAPISITDSKYHYFVMTQSGANICFYVDGVLVGTATGASASLGGTTVYFGRYASSNREFFPGTFATVRLSSIARSAAEIKNNWLRQTQVNII